MFRFTLRPACLAAASALAVGAAGCSGGHSLLPGVGPQLANDLRAGRMQRFVPLRHQPPVPGIQLTFLMTDGTVLAQTSANSTWYRLTPDSSGSYANGTWKQAASLQDPPYGPSAFASAVQIDGRFVITGGEYNYPGNGYQLQLTDLGAVYDPVANTWTPLGHPNSWTTIGDSPSAVLANGDYLVGQKLTHNDAVLNPHTLKWKTVGDKGKSDFNSEEGWTLLPNGTILTADVKNAPNSEIYHPATHKWTSAGSTIVDLHSPSPYGCLLYGPSLCYYPPGEIGPAMLRPDGTVFATGSAPNGTGTGHTAVYTIATGKWAAGPDFPNGDNAGDSWGVLLPSGNVLVFGVSGEMYEFNGTSWAQDGGASGPPLLLPSGQVLMMNYGSAVLFNPSGSPKASWAPAIATAPSTVTRGQTYKISGTQFNGLSMAMAFGDEYENATNYPLVRITNNTTKHVFYARTHDHSTMGVATGTKSVSTNFDVPKNADTGASTLVVVANGIASKPVNVTVK
ncbi:MAG TPA: hypothetical protein VIW73_11225 [Candidatus Cybelea sp.]